MYIMIDNYDSFVYNLCAYFKELKKDIQVLRNDQIDIGALAEARDIEGLIISPGPKSPEDCGLSVAAVQSLYKRLPILGVCLGHQIIGHSFGAAVIKGNRPMHGKITPITHNGQGLFKGIDASYPVTRYHSLVVDEATLPDSLVVDAKAEDGAVMAISHKNFPVYGVQFHPEAVLTHNGHQLLENFTKICDAWRYSA
ncbi:MAG: aminodeoxychorismate/anthranilate synthase component II [Eubacterium sp.]|nr:aminodeoxychorismate/anthranilate synthase component II [Eubacterium sp.]